MKINIMISYKRGEGLTEKSKRFVVRWIERLVLKRVFQVMVY